MQLRENPCAEPGWQVLSSVLEEANLLPTWVEESLGIRAEIGRFRAESAHAKDARRARQCVECLNKRITAFNLVAPLLQLQLPFLNVEREMQRCRVIER